MLTKQGRHFDARNGYVELLPRLRILRGKRIPLTAFSAATLWGFETDTVPKVGMTLHSSECDVFFGAWETGFAYAQDHYRLDRYVPKDWYSRAEKGEQFRIELADSQSLISLPFCA